MFLLKIALCVLIINNESLTIKFLNLRYGQFGCLKECKSPICEFERMLK